MTGTLIIIGSLTLIAAGALLGALAVAVCAVTTHANDITHDITTAYERGRLDGQATRILHELELDNPDERRVIA